MNNFNFNLTNFLDLLNNNNNYDEFINNLYDNFLDMPLTSPIIDPEIQDALQLNNQLVHSIHSIRRYLELEDNYNRRYHRRPSRNRSRNRANNTESNNNIEDMQNSENNTSTSSLEQTPQSRYSSYFRTPYNYNNYNNHHLNSHEISTNRNTNNTSNNNNNTDFLEYTQPTSFVDIFQNIINVLNDSEALLQTINTEPSLEDVKITISQEEFNELKTQNLSEKLLQKLIEDEVNNCNICMEQYEVNNNITTLPCKHIFHKECIKAWLCQEKVNCPICRHDVRENK
jgi:hypothetical protein